MDRLLAQILRETSVVDTVAHPLGQLACPTIILCRTWGTTIGELDGVVGRFEVVAVRVIRLCKPLTVCLDKFEGINYRRDSLQPRSIIEFHYRLDLLVVMLNSLSDFRLSRSELRLNCYIIILIPVIRNSMLLQR